MDTLDKPSADSNTAAAERGEAAPAPRLDAPPSNRASNTCIAASLHVLSRHVDSLELSFRGSLKPEIEAHLNHLKVLAQSRDEAHRAQAQLVIAGQVFK